MTAFGDFSGGAVLTHADGRPDEAFEMRPGQVILMRSSKVMHSIAQFEGVRYGMVCFYHEDVMEEVEKNM